MVRLVLQDNFGGNKKNIAPNYPDFRGKNPPPLVTRGSWEGCNGLVGAHCYCQGSR